MSPARYRAWLLWCAATDKTWNHAELRGEIVLAGNCIHCNSVLCMSLTGERLSRRPTLEHIVPQTHGGRNSLENLAIACGRCNGAKGRMHDWKSWNDPGLQEMIERLQTRHRARFREAPQAWSLPSLPTEEEDKPVESVVASQAESAAGGRARGRGRGQGTKRTKR